MTSVEAARHVSSLSSSSGETDYLSYSEGEKVNEEKEERSVSAAMPARFEAYTMTGNLILSKTNIRQTHNNAPSDKRESRSGDVGWNQKRKALSPTNIVLHSPPLRNRKSPSETTNGVEEDSAATSRAEKEKEEACGNTFEYSAHDLHGFTLSTVVGQEKKIAYHHGDADDGARNSDIVRICAAVTPAEEVSFSTGCVNTGCQKEKENPGAGSVRGPLTTDLVLDDRPVWTINAPVNKTTVKAISSLPASPHRTGSGRGYREILKEETIITDTTISEVTDTKTAVTYILPSPRTPRNFPSRVNQPTSTTDFDHQKEGVQRIADPADATGGESETVAKITSFSDHNGDVELDVLRVVVEEPYSGSAEELNGKQPVQGIAEKGVPFVHPESARACMEMFPLDGYSLESALRLFLSQVKLVGETQARQRVVDLFAMRYVECNPTGGYNKDSAYAVVTAMLILNSDLHSQHRPHQTSNPTRFLNSIREIPCCAGVSTDEIHDIYNSIKSEPLPMPPDAQLDFPSVQADDAKDMDDEKIYHSGYLIRKSCVEPGGKPTRFGNRGWHKVFVSLRDLTLELYKKEPSLNGSKERIMVTIPLHHGYVTRAVDYRKRPNVLRWRGLDESISLFQAASPQEMDAWLAAMNYNAARFSAPVSLPVGSQTMAPTASVARNKTLAVRPLYPSKRSALSLEEQCGELEESLERLRREIDSINSHQPASRAEALFMSSQLNLYKQEEERARVYLERLQNCSCGQI